jgi:multiple sugar transport system permease protein
MVTTGHPPTGREGRLAALLVSPTVLVLALVVGFPLLEAFRQSLYGAPGVDPATGFVAEREPLVGLRNFTDIFTDQGERFWNAIGNTTFFGVATIVPEVLIGMAMALLMARALRGRGLIRSAILVPWAIPTAISGLLWSWIFNVDGVANKLLGTDVLWATEGFQAKLSIIIAEVWKTAPFVALLTLPGLLIIPREVYEAARIDGATAWQRFAHVTLPLVKPALTVAVLFRMLDALRMFDLPYILVGPRKSSVETLSMLAQNEAYNVRYGAAAAYAIILFGYVFVIAFVFVRVLGVNIANLDSVAPRRARRRVRVAR